MNEGNLIVIHKFEVLECKKHIKAWGQRRGEEMITIAEQPLDNVNLSDSELHFFRAVFPCLWDGKLNASDWRDSVQKYMKVEDCESMTNSWIQKGMIYKQAVFLKSNIEPKIYFLLTNKGRLDLKARLNYSTIEERKEVWLARIHDSIEKSKQNIALPVIVRDTITTILLQERARIRAGNPGFFKDDDKRVLPTNSLLNRPKYDIILYSLCTWLLIWKPILTVRELSARSVVDIARDYGDDPSKVIEEYWHDLEDIVYYNGKVAIEELGLMNKLKFVHYSGELVHFGRDGKDDMFRTLSNYYLMQNPGLKLTTSARNLLVVENSAAFFHATMVLERIHPGKWFIIYSGGQVDSFLPSVACRLIRDNDFEKIIFWVDNDLGGLTILTTFLQYLANQELDKKKWDNITALYKIPKQFENLAFNKKQAPSIARMLEKSKFQMIKDIGRYIMEKGSIEQEVFLSNLEEFLEFNDIM
ncbi:MAG: hypothetical protein Q6373_019810 [Candidatus Sigynarchaeota archaeon]